MYKWTDFFSDPLLRAPMIGSLLMCLCASLVGVIVVIRRRSLLGEALSHASYPGIVLGALFFGSCFSFLPQAFSSFLLIGAFLTSLLGLLSLNSLEKLFRVKNDAALCFVLSSFFGIGVLFSSRVQYTHPLWYKQIQAFLYGQPATMTDGHVWMYGILCAFVIAFFALFYRSIQLVNFDYEFASSLGLKPQRVEAIFFCLLVLAVTIAIRGVGLVLLSGMLIAPALAARQMTCSLGKMFVFSSIVGSLSAYMGNYLSAQLPYFLEAPRLVLPIGPLIILSSSVLCFFSLLFAPKRGLFVRWLRKKRFSRVCEEENLLKLLWKSPKNRALCFTELSRLRQRSWIQTWCIMRRLFRYGWVEKVEQGYTLSEDGKIKASQVVRLHRLWEVYLVELGQSREKVHASAEEMEHVITPELERRLSEHLNHPKVDPHCQPIPKSEGSLS